MLKAARLIDEQKATVIVEHLAYSLVEDSHTRVQLNDTQFAVAQFHYLSVGGTILAYLGGVHYWWPKLTGRVYPERWARIAAVTTFIGVNLTFIPQLILGCLGVPSRVHGYSAGFVSLNQVSTAGAALLGLGLALPAGYLTWCLVFGPTAVASPWCASGLEWRTASPPLQGISSLLRPQPTNLMTTPLWPWIGWTDFRAAEFTSG